MARVDGDNHRRVAGFVAMPGDERVEAANILGIFGNRAEVNFVRLSLLASDQ